eukprot:TRINITY_DN9853_c0_g1_i1.p2 TRINITY_DN9853_c0_g1~~TRINITY_DN9853_c0_g1_i1.p2  ORF type:complete len:52 (-),score=3.85 TRINITY_DN9853_c0_g1_i1:181-336(-)
MLDVTVSLSDNSEILGVNKKQRITTAVLRAIESRPAYYHRFGYVYEKGILC